MGEGNNLSLPRKSPTRNRVASVATLCFLAASIAWVALAQIGPSGAEAGQPGDPTACTLVGCVSGLHLDLRSARKGDSAAKKVKICVKRRCMGFSRHIRYATFVIGGLKLDRNVKVRMTVYRKGGKVLRRSSVKARVYRSRPNGPKCPPTCFYIRAEISKQTGELVRA